MLAFVHTGLTILGLIIENLSTCGRNSFMFPLNGFLLIIRVFVKKNNLYSLFVTKITFTYILTSVILSVLVVSKEFSLGLKIQVFQ